MVLTPGPGEMQGVLAFVVNQHLIDQLKQLAHLTWFLGSKLVGDIKVKSKTGAFTPRLSGTGSEGRRNNHFVQYIPIRLPRKAPPFTFL